MDDGTKLSTKQLFGLLSALKGNKADGPADPEALLRAYLSEAQADAAKQILADPQRLQNLLRQPQIRALLEKLQTETNPDGADGT